jgi:hypothetical protein
VQPLLLFNLALLALLGNSLAAHRPVWVATLVLLLAVGSAILWSACGDC